MRYAMGIVLAFVLTFPLAPKCGLVRGANVAPATCCARPCSMPAGQRAADCCASAPSSIDTLAYHGTPPVFTAALPLGRIQSRLLLSPSSRPYLPRLLPSSSPPLRDIICSRQI